MANLPQRWTGIVLKIVRGYYPDAELAAWGPLVEGSPSGTLELVIVEPRNPDADTISAIRGEIERSDLPVPCDLRPLIDLTVPEQNEALDRGVRFGG